MKEKLHRQVDERVYEIFDSKVANANVEREKAEKIAEARENQLIAEAKQRKRIQDICTVIGIAFAICGLIVATIGNLLTGTALTIAGIAFIALALGFRNIKIKAGTVELEANRES
jgi:hypothetical protein